MNPPSTSERFLTTGRLISPNYGARQLDDNDITTPFVPRLDGSVMIPDRTSWNISLLNDPANEMATSPSTWPTFSPSFLPHTPQGDTSLGEARTPVPGPPSKAFPTSVVESYSWINPTTEAALMSTKT
ncbi:hypothetical protein OIDMADRAFT_56682 [Oidiodendron maius Zn]|uniref:Uncharacterized protein n=1 Tax=Oidiodendron maius (strain Zn) TaxID=913774 RepID=A0A0C3H7A8_OIDMZ|nr:hypothetical protein OIDMADRAFT_56682 [Oidiodendron maius Zn]